ncbi:uncharacterized protein LOC116765379 [Danaus plexippus]|uniref:uncharacterized protein LOC116765379 n=1 Tax=Danaus plexippus TaxID=13037 RepID=UPI002AB1F25A|nr:uncharacterized protein LOC116765379 [Danaus plexippus]
MDGCKGECTGIIKVPFECKSDDISVKEPAVSDEESERRSVSSLKTSEDKEVPVREGLLKRIRKRLLEFRRRIKEKKIGKKKKPKPVKAIKKEKIKKQKETVKTINPEEFTGDRKWLWEEFQVDIGVPRRSDTKPSAALCDVRYKRFIRFVPESYFYNEPKKADAVFLSSKTPIKKCLCPIRECFCIDNFMQKKKRVPGCCRINLYGYIDIPRLHLFDLCSKRPKIKPYIEKLEATVDSLRPPMGLRSMGKVNKEFCITKCRKCLAKSGFQHFQYVPTFPKTHKTIDDEKSSQHQKDVVDDKKTNGEKKNRRKVSQLKQLKEPTKLEPKEKQKEDQIENQKEVSNEEQKAEQKEEPKIRRAENQTGDQKKKTNKQIQEEQKEGQQKEQKEGLTENQQEEANKTLKEQKKKEVNEEKTDEREELEKEGDKEENIEQKEESEIKNDEERKEDKIREKSEGRRKLNCNSYSCTVSTQTEFGPNGELDVIKFSHLLFASVEKIILPDITGKKLFLSQCKYVPDCSTVDSDVTLINMDKLLDINEIKCRLSKLVSSIFELQDLPRKLNRTKIPKIRFGSFMGCDNETCPKTQHSDKSTVKNNHINYDRNISEIIRGKGIVYENKMNECENPNCNELQPSDACEKKACVVEVNKVSDANVNTLPGSDVIPCSDISDGKCKNKISKASERNENSSQEIRGNVENSDNNHEKISSLDMLNEAKENNPQEGFTKTKVIIVKLPPEDKVSVQKITNTGDFKLNICPNEDAKSQIRFIKEMTANNDDDTLNDNTKTSDDKQQAAIRRRSAAIRNDNETGSLKEPDRDQGFESRKDSKTSKDKNDSMEKVLPKKGTYTFSSTYRWLMDKIFPSDQIEKKLSSKCSANDSKLKLRKSGTSEREVFSMRYTSTASIQKSSSAGNN